MRRVLSEMVLGLRERRVMNVSEVGLDREVGDDWEGWCRVRDSVRVCVCVFVWVGGWMCV